MLSTTSIVNHNVSPIFFNDECITYRTRTRAEHSVNNLVPNYQQYVSSFQKHKTLVLGQNDLELKKLYGEDVYTFLYEKYKLIGGIDKGKGFKDVDDMIANIPVWRLRLIDNKIVSAMMFKVNNYGKKMVAYACVKQLSVKMKKLDFMYMLNSSYAELSGGLLVTILKMPPELLHKYVLKADNLMKHKKIYPLRINCSNKSISATSTTIFERLKKQWPELLSFCYIRKIGDEKKLKLIMGTPDKSFLVSHLAFPG